MIYTIENDLLKVSVTTYGAQLCSVIRKCDGVEHIWQADKSVWGYHAPILFPFTGKLTGGAFEAKGQRYECGQHGFARTSEHTFVRQSANEIVMELTDSPETLAKWPWKFRLVSTYTLEGDCVRHKLTVENRDEDRMSFGIGYHPAFCLPFDENHTAEDYEFRFDRPQSPMVINCMPGGLITGEVFYLSKNTDTIPLTEKTFANDSLCMTGLTARTLGIYEKDTGRGVACDISAFPYALIWSKTDWPAPFVCVEPWMSLPGTREGSIDWNEKAAAAVLEPGQNWSCELPIHFVR